MISPDTMKEKRRSHIPVREPRLPVHDPRLSMIEYSTSSEAHIYLTHRCKTMETQTPGVVETVYPVFGPKPPPSPSRRSTVVQTTPLASPVKPKPKPFPGESFTLRPKRLSLNVKETRRLSRSLDTLLAVGPSSPDSPEPLQVCCAKCRKEMCSDRTGDESDVESSTSDSHSTTTNQQQWKLDNADKINMYLDSPTPLIAQTQNKRNSTLDERRAQLELELDSLLSSMESVLAKPTDEVDNRPFSLFLPSRLSSPESPDSISPGSPMVLRQVFDLAI